MFGGGSPGSGRYVLDELTAALGRFAIFVIVSGAAERDDSTTLVTISKIGVYIRDSFDFNGDQALGYWRKPDRSDLGDRAGIRDGPLRPASAVLG